MAEERTAVGTVWDDLRAPAEARACNWASNLRAGEAAEAGLLGGLRRDPESFEFTRRLLELVAGTEDAFTSALGLREMAQDVPASMPTRDRLAVRAGGVASIGLPWAVMPVARRWLRERVSHLVLATKLPSGGSGAGRLTVLADAMRRHAEAGFVPVVKPLGEAIHGANGAKAEIARLVALIAHPAVKHIVIDPARVAPGGSDWSVESDVARAAAALRPVFEASVEHDTTVHIEPTTVRWARLIPELLERGLADPALDRARIATRLFAELPEAREQYDRLSRWAQRRVADGGAPSEVILGIAGVAGAERISSIQSGLAVPVIEERVLLTANLLRLIELALHPARAAVLKPVIATEDICVLAATAELAEVLGSTELAAIQMRSGIALGLADTVASFIGEVRMVVPVAAPNEFAGAIDTLIGFAAEAADPGSAVSRLENLIGAAQQASGLRNGAPVDVERDPASPKVAESSVASANAAGADTAESSTPVLSDPVLSNPMLSDPVLSDPMLSNPMSSTPENSFSDAETSEVATPDTDVPSSVEAASDMFKAVSNDDACDLLAVECAVFRAAVTEAVDQPPAPHRTQRRATEWDPSERDSALFYRAPDEPARFDTGGLTAAVLGLSRGSGGGLELGEFAPSVAIPVISASGFANEPETDASVADNRTWVRERFARARSDAHHRDAANATVALSAADLDPAAAAEATRAAGQSWAEQSHQIRSVRLRRAALAVVAARDRMLEALASDTGAPVAELDAEVNDIVDAARYCGQLAAGLAAVRGASFVPDRLVLVTASAATPLSSQAEAVLAALAAGSGVLWSVPQHLFGSASVMLEEWEVGGITAGVVRLEAVVAGRTLGELAANHHIDRAVVLGERSAARELAKRRPDLRIEGRFEAVGSVLIAPSADLDLAIPDIVTSAFRGAGAGPRAAHRVILMGSVARSKRFRSGLADAVRAVRVGDTARPGDENPLSFEMGPLAAPPSDAGLRALTQLGRGEEWLVEPKQLDDDGRLWSPGVRTGVSASSSFWEDARGVPVVGIVQAHTFSEAVAMQIADGSGAVAGLQANDADEVLSWLDSVEAAALSVNRPTTAVRIERQPGGGWNDAVMGLPALSGGPNWLFALGSWEARSGTRSETLHLRGLDPEVQLLIEGAQASLSYDEFDALRRAALSDALAWRTSLGVMRDTSGLGIERNVMRYWPVSTQLRLVEGGKVSELLRVVAAALLVRAPVAVSTGEVLPSEVLEFLAKLGIEVSLERDDDWIERLAVSGPAGADGEAAARVRLIGGDRVRVAEWMGGLDRAALWAEPVTMAGPVELLTLLREQSVSARAHRHNLAIPVAGLDELIEG